MGQRGGRSHGAGHPGGKKSYGSTGGRGKTMHGMGNADLWREDDMRVALIVLLMATFWIIMTIRRRQGKDGWLDNLGLGFGMGSSARSFARQGCFHFFVTIVIL